MDILNYSHPVCLQQGSFGFYDNISRWPMPSNVTKLPMNWKTVPHNESNSSGSKSNGDGNNKQIKTKANAKTKNVTSRNRKRGCNRDDDSMDSDGNKHYQRKKKVMQCKICKKFCSGKCRYAKDNGKNSTHNYPKEDNNKSNGTKKMVSIEVFHVVIKKSLLKRLTQKASCKCKRLMIDYSSDKEVNLTTVDSDDEGGELNFMARLIRQPLVIWIMIITVMFPLTRCIHLALQHQLVTRSQPKATTLLE